MSMYEIETLKSRTMGEVEKMISQFDSKYMRNFVQSLKLEPTDRNAEMYTVVRKLRYEEVENGERYFVCNYVNKTVEQNLFRRRCR